MVGRSPTRWPIWLLRPAGADSSGTIRARRRLASPYDYETINAALLPLTRRIPPREIAAEVVAAAEAADRAAAATPATLIGEIRRLNQVKLERAEHRRSHLDDIEALLAST